MPTPNLNLPRYRSHKIVTAAKIGHIRYEDDGTTTITPADIEGIKINTAVGYRERFKAEPAGAVGGVQDLGYYVRYEDGYESWSPTKAFEEGYTRVEG